MVHRRRSSFCSIFLEVRSIADTGRQSRKTTTLLQKEDRGNFETATFELEKKKIELNIAGACGGYLYQQNYALYDRVLYQRKDVSFFAGS